MIVYAFVDDARLTGAPWESPGRVRRTGPRSVVSYFVMRFPLRVCEYASTPMDTEKQPSALTAGMLHDTAKAPVVQMSRHRADEASLPPEPLEALMEPGSLADDPALAEAIHDLDV